MKKIIILLAIMSMFIVGIAYAVADSATINRPASGGTIDGSSTIGLPDFNISWTINNPIEVINCSVSMTSTSTANSSVGLIFNISNSSLDTGNNDGRSINYTLASKDILEDSNDYTVTASCFNGSKFISATSKTNVVVQRTTPTAPTTTQASESTLKSGDTVTYTVTGTDTTKCRLSFGGAKSSGTNTYPMTHSGNTCTYTLTDVMSDGAYDLYAWASDGTDSVFSSKLLINVNTVSDDSIGTGDGYSIDVAKSVVGKRISNELIITIIVIIVILALSNMKKK